MISSRKKRSACQHCEALIVGPVFSVGAIGSDGDRFVLCDACWFTGVTPEYSKRIRGLGWRP